MSADRVALFEADITASPGALAGLLDTWVAPDLGGRRRVVFIGLGSSRFAALIVEAQVRAAVLTAWVEYASTTAPTDPAWDLVVVAISASGRTHEVLDAAERHRGRSLVIAMTNVCRPTPMTAVTGSTPASTWPCPDTGPPVPRSGVRR